MILRIEIQVLKYYKYIKKFISLVPLHRPIDYPVILAQIHYIH